MDGYVLIDIDKEIRQLIFLFFIIIALYCFFFAIVGLDFFSGTSKAKKAGIKLTSEGYRRTFDKLKGYLIPLISFTLLDTMQLISIWYLNVFEKYDFPLFSWFTLIGIGLASFIEIKSIYEKIEDKERFKEVGNLAVTIVSDPKNIQKISEAVGDYMNSENDNPENK